MSLIDRDPDDDHPYRPLSTIPGVNAPATPPTRCEACASLLPSPGALAFVARGYPILGCPRCRLRWTHIPASSAFDPTALYTQAYFEGGVPDGYYDYAGSEELLAREYANRLQVI